MIGQALGVFIRGLPPQLVDGLASGELKLFGSIIRHTSNGQIAGFLQETGVGNLASLAMKGASPLSAVTGAVTGVATIIQNEQIKSAVVALHELQLGSLALGAAGIGVSVVGFAVMSRKIDRVRQQVDALGDRIDAVARTVALLREDMLTKDFVGLKTAVEQVDEAFRLEAPADQWRDAARSAHELQNRFESRALDVLREDKTHDAVEPFAAAYALASSVRVSARLAAGDEDAARAAADGAATTMRELTGRFNLTDLVLQQVRVSGAEAGTLAFEQALDAARAQAAPAIAATRARESAALSTPLTLAELRRRDIPGRAWLETARGETEVPVLLLEARPGT